MEQAIKKAIKGGWKYQNNPKTDYTVRTHDLKIYFNNENDTKIYIGFFEVLLDPLFWQALGKVEGWNMTDRFQPGDRQTHWEMIPDMYAKSMTVFERSPALYQHLFIDHINSGKDVDSFFKNLLNNHN